MEPMDGASMLVSREPRPFPGGCLLTTNSGFGGINAALILGA
jgi:3-oxoacyl-[acyl-carrier-protein] synthase II